MLPTTAPAQTPIAAPAAPYRIPWLLRLPYPARTMLRRWRGMLGMMLGVGIALSLAMTMMAVSKASTDLFSKDFIVSGADLYLVTEGGQMIAILPGDTPGTIQHARHVLAQTRAIPGVQSAVGVMNWSMERERDGPQRRDGVAELIATMGVDGDPQTIPNMLALDQGRWLRRGNEIVVGSKLAREKGLSVGDTLRLNGRDFTIVGVGKLRGFGFGADALAYMDYGSFQDRAGIGDVVNIIAVDTTQPALVRERLPEIGSLSASSPQELVRKAEEVNASGVVIRWIFSLMALAIGALFVSNMLSRSVVERRLEFATLKAIGIPSRTILMVVAAEAVLVSLVATVFGIGVSLFFGLLLNATIAVQFGFESLYSADVVSFLVVFLLALGLGVVAGLAPARRATRVDPVDILREA
jgi:putative ABC transport system permease protein